MPFVDKRKTRPEGFSSGRAVGQAFRQVVSEPLPLTSMPIATTLVLFPGMALAFFPTPIIGMNLDVDARREGVVFLHMPAVAVFVAYNAGGCAQR
jgi:hypothetical protein